MHATYGDAPTDESLRNLGKTVCKDLRAGNSVKDEILALYLNRVYFGAGAYGIEAASQRYFDKPAKNLTVGEAALLAGLQEIQRIAGPDDLAGMTAVFYSLCYLGFGVPAAMAFLSHWVSYPVMFGFGVVAAGLSLVVAVAGSQRVPAIN